MMWTGRRHPRSGQKNIAHCITQTAAMYDLFFTALVPNRKCDLPQTCVSALRYSRIWKQRPDYECAEMI